MPLYYSSSSGGAVLAARLDIGGTILDGRQPKGMRIEERATEILHYLSRLQGDFAKFRDDFAVLGKHLGHAHASFQASEKRLEKFAQKLLSADAEQEELSPPRAAVREAGSK